MGKFRYVSITSDDDFPLISNSDAREAARPTASAIPFSDKAEGLIPSADQGSSPRPQSILLMDSRSEEVGLLENKRLALALFLHFVGCRSRHDVLTSLATSKEWLEMQDKQQSRKKY